MIWFILFILCMTTPGNTTSVTQVTQGEGRPTVFFHEQDRLFHTNWWTCFLQIDLGNLASRIDELQEAHARLEGYNNLFTGMLEQGTSQYAGTTAESMMSNFVAEYSQLQRQMQNLKERMTNIHKFIQPSATRRSHRRSRRFAEFLALGASMYNYNNFRRLHTKVSRLRRNQQALTETMQLTLKIVNQTHIQTALNAQHITKLANHVNVLTNKFRDMSYDITWLRNITFFMLLAKEYESVVENLDLACEDMHSIIRNIELGLEKAVLNKLSTTLVPQIELENMLRVIEQNLRQDYKIAFQLSQLELLYNYCYVKLVPAQDDATLMLVVQIPLYDMSNYVTIHKIVPLPIYQSNLAMYTSVITPSENLAISQDKSYYGFLTNYQRQQTKVLKSIPEDFILQGRHTNPSCISEIFFQDGIDLPKCQFQVKHSPYVLQLLSEDRYYFTGTGPITVKITCSNESMPTDSNKYITLEPETQIKIAPGCVLIHKEFKIYSKRASIYKSIFQNSIPSFIGLAKIASPFLTLNFTNFQKQKSASTDEVKLIFDSLEASQSSNIPMTLEMLNQKLADIRQSNESSDNASHVDLIWNLLASACIIIFFISAASGGYKLYQINKLQHYCCSKYKNKGTNPTEVPLNQTIPTHIEDDP